MNINTMKFVVILMMLATCSSLWSKNRLMADWSLKDLRHTQPDMKSIQRSSQALALAKGLAIIQQPGRSEYLQTSAPITVEQFNIWLRALGSEQISPESLTLKPASGEGKLIMSEIGFKK